MCRQSASDDAAPFFALWRRPFGPPRLDDVPAPPAEPVLPAGTVTAMLRNIPNKYTHDGLLEQLHERGYGAHVDFIYVPIDFRNRRRRPAGATRPASAKEKGSMFLGASKLKPLIARAWAGKCAFMLCLDVRGGC